MSHHINIGDNMHISPHVNNHTIGGEAGFHGSHGSIGELLTRHLRALLGEAPSGTPKNNSRRVGTHHHGENTFGGTGTLHLPYTLT